MMTMPAARHASATMPALCLAACIVVWGILAVAPSYREDWLLENLLTIVVVPVAVLTYRRFRFSDLAYVQATVFLILHTIGGHYTYSEVPIGDWLRDAAGLGRNHYDRFVHFAFGLFMLRPLREVSLRRPDALSPVARAWLSIAQVLACSLLYELIEWVVASLVEPSAGTAYLGTQGDVWDSQKDMACAAAGAIIAAAIDNRARRREARRAE